MKVTLTKFGKTRTVNVESIYNMSEDETPDEILWVERSEDYYALISPQLKDKKVAVVSRSEWLRAGGDDQLL